MSLKSLKEKHNWQGEKQLENQEVHALEAQQREDEEQQMRLAEEERERLAWLHFWEKVWLLLIFSEFFLFLIWQKEDLLREQSMLSSHK